MKKLLIGSELNPFDKQIFRQIAIASFFAWIGLGADSLSSSCYGPQEAYLALGPYAHLALIVALATAFTIFVLALGYNQVIELFPNGGGGYKVATQIINPYVGLVAGAALLIDYALTITISIASCTNVIFSLLPRSLHHYHLYVSVTLVLVLFILNLRGVKESIRILLPIFLGFVITHFAIILYGLMVHHQKFSSLISETVNQSIELKRTIGWLPLLFILIHSYSVGAGTYTGLESVSNNVHHLAEPRVRTGTWSMWYIAISLSFTVCGLMLLFLMWDVKPTFGLTLNAALFHEILGSSFWERGALVLLLFFEAGLLLVAANTGFIAGPTALGNMALDDWVPNRFRHLSNRLVMQNSLFIFGIGSILLLLWTRGQIQLLVILYSIDVFITFSLALLGICIFWWRHRKKDKRWFHRLPFSILSFLISTAILFGMILTKFSEGGWVTLVITFSLVVVCLFIKRHYNFINAKLKLIDASLTLSLGPIKGQKLPLDPGKPTAIFFIGRSRGMGIHLLSNALELFPDHFFNFIFITAGVVDVKSFQGEDTLLKMQSTVENNLDYFVEYCRQKGYSAEKQSIYDTQIIDPLINFVTQIIKKYEDVTFFAGELVIDNESWWDRLLDNKTAEILQREIFELQRQLIILPMKIT